MDSSRRTDSSHVCVQIQRFQSFLCTDSMKDGFQLSALMKVTDAAKTGNGIIVTRASTENGSWHIGTAGAEYNADKTNPTMMKGTRPEIKRGSLLSFYFSAEYYCIKKIPV